MEQSTLLSSLSLTTILVAVIILAVLFALFLRKKSNRHPMDTPKGQDAEEMRRRDALENQAEEKSDTTYREM